MDTMFFFFVHMFVCMNVFHALAPLESFLISSLNTTIYVCIGAMIAYIDPIRLQT